MIVTLFNPFHVFTSTVELEVSGYDPIDHFMIILYDGCVNFVTLNNFECRESPIYYFMSFDKGKANSAICGPYWAVYTDIDFFFNMESLASPLLSVRSRRTYIVVSVEFWMW